MFFVIWIFNLSFINFINHFIIIISYFYHFWIIISIIILVRVIAVKIIVSYHLD
jgi:hypothetical protein